MNKNTRRRGRSAAALGSVAGIALAGTAVLGTTASSAPPPGDCAVPFPVSDLTDGQAVTGLTVSKGTAPEDFSGEVLGVIDSGIAPGLDMIMVRLESPAIDQAGGIWQGMSGSPVYADDGRLIGAVAYGLAWGPSPVAGVTPFEDMDDYLAPRAAARKVKVSGAEAREVAAETEVSRRQAEQGFAQLKMPMNVSGVSSRRLSSETKDRPYLYQAVRSAGGSGGAADTDASDLVAGGNVGASASYGDILAGGVGTVTSVCGDEVIGFGHPFMFAGRTTLGLHPASAIYIQEDPVSAPFKVANFGPVVGTIDEDRATGISGAVGPAPEAVDIVSAATYKTRARTGETHVELPDFVPSGVIYALWGNQDRVFDAWTSGGATQSWSINGTRPNGKSFTLRDSDRYVSDYDITLETPWDVADAAYLLSSIPNVTLNSIDVDTQLEDNSTTWALSKVQQRKAGKWVTVRNRVTARGGAKLRLRAVLSDGTNTKNMFWTYRVPKKLIGGWADLQVVGGLWDWDWDSDANPSISKVLKDAENGLRNDQLKWTLEGSGRGGDVRVTHVSKPQSRVIEGEDYFSVNVGR